MPSAGRSFSILVLAVLLAAPPATALPAKEPTVVADVLCTLPLLFPPANDCFTRATPISNPGARGGSNTDARVETGEPLPCGDMGATVWYRVSASSGLLVAYTEQASFDTVLAVYSGTSLASLQTIACHDDPAALTSSVTWTAARGVTYWIQLGGKGGATGAASLRLETGVPVVACNDGVDNDGDNRIDYPVDPGCESETDEDETDPVIPCESPVANDCFWTAQPIAAPSVTSGSNVGASMEPDEPAQCGAIGATVWFSLTGASGAMVVDAINSSFETVIVVYAGNWGDLEFVNCGFPGVRERVSWTSDANETYWIQLGGVWGATGTYVLNVGAGTPSCPGPANNCFADALPVAIGSTTTGNNVGATEETWEPTPCGDMPATVWFRVDATQDGPLTADSGASPSTPSLGIFTGSSLRDLVHVGCASAASDHRVTWTAFAGTTYWIQLGGRPGAAGDYVLHVHAGAPS